MQVGSSESRLPPQPHIIFNRVLDESLPLCARGTVQSLLSINPAQSLTEVMFEILS